MEQTQTIQQPRTVTQMTLGELNEARKVAERARLVAEARYDHAANFSWCGADAIRAIEREFAAADAAVARIRRELMIRGAL